MKMKTKTLVIIIVVIVLAIAVYMFRDKIFGKKKSEADDSVEQKFADATAANDTVPVYVAPTAPTVNNTSSTPKGAEAMAKGVVFNNANRTITVDGVNYGFASKSEVQAMQSKLITGLEKYASMQSSNGIINSTLVPVAKELADTMRKKGGADGVIGQATANAFAFAARLVPSIVSTYKK